MLRKRVLKHWASVTGVNSEKLRIPESMRTVLADDSELTIAEMKKWVLRKCDVPEYKYWMPHRIVTGSGYVRTYYVWVGPDPAPEHTIVLLVGAGRAEIHKWTGDRVEIIPAVKEDKPSVERPDINESMQIMKYLSDFKQSSGTMTIDGKQLTQIKK